MLITANQLKYLLYLPLSIILVGFASLLAVLYVDMAENELDKRYIRDLSAQGDFCGCESGDILITAATDIRGNTRARRCLSLDKVFPLTNNGVISGDSVFEDSLNVKDSSKGFTLYRGGESGTIRSDSDTITINGTSQPLLFDRSRKWENSPVIDRTSGVWDSIYFYTLSEDDNPMGCLFGDIYSKQVKSGNGGEVEQNYKDGRCCPVGYVTTSYWHAGAVRRICCYADGLLERKNSYTPNGENNIDITGVKTDGFGQADDKGAEIELYDSNRRGSKWFTWTEQSEDSLRTARYSGWDERDPETIRKTIDNGDDAALCQTPDSPAGRPGVGDYSLKNIDYFLADYITCTPTPEPLYDSTIIGCSAFLAKNGILDNYKSEIVEHSNEANSAGITEANLDFDPLIQADPEKPDEIREAIEAVFTDEIEVPPDLQQRFFKMCDSCSILDRPGSSIEELSELNSCLLCEDDLNTIWTDFGCIEATGSGIVNWLNRFALGISGFIIILRGGQVVIMLVFSPDDSSKTGEVKEIGGATLMYLILIAGGYIILRFLAYNIIGIEAPVYEEGFGGAIVTPTP